ARVHPGGPGLGGDRGCWPAAGPPGPAGPGPGAGGGPKGEPIAIPGHRDGACYDRAVTAMLDDLSVSAPLVPCGPEQAMHRMLRDGEALVLTTAPTALPHDVVARPLEMAGTVPFALLWRDETPSPALGEFVRIAANPPCACPSRGPRWPWRRDGRPKRPQASGESPAAAEHGRGGQPGAADRARRPEGQGPDDRVQPAACVRDRQTASGARS